MKSHQEAALDDIEVQNTKLVAVAKLVLQVEMQLHYGSVGIWLGFSIENFELGEASARVDADRVSDGEVVAVELAVVAPKAIWKCSHNSSLSVIKNIDMSGLFQPNTANDNC